MKLPSIKKNYLLWFFAAFFIFYFFNLFNAYNREFSAFGCFDECFNYVSGYFLLKGRPLYTGIYFNHQPFMAYISYGLQILLHPDSLYHLVLYHRMFIFFAALIMDIFIIFRFRIVGVGFVLFFETTKFFFMGSLFLAESLVVYPLVYLLGVVILKLYGKNISAQDVVISGICAWFVIFTREPYVISAIFLFLLILWGRSMLRVKIISFCFFIFLSLFSIATLHVGDYISQVIQMNINGVAKSEIEANNIFGKGLIEAFFYPFFIFTNGTWTFVRKILIGFDIFFLSSIFLLLFKNKKNIFVILVVLATLGFSNLRFVAPGFMFYQSFHMLVWYGLFIISTFFFLWKLCIDKQSKTFLSTLLFLLFAFFTYVAASPESFLRNTIDREKQYISNFDHYYVFGEAVRLLSSKKDTVFVDGGNDLIYWQTKLDSSYKYARYEGSGSSILDTARIAMFQYSPPDFYYYYLCTGKEYKPAELLLYQKDNYVAINYLGKPCLYVKKTKLLSVSSSTLEKLRVLRFSLPSMSNF